MCKVLFVAAAMPLPLRSETTPPAPLSVRELRDVRAPVRAQFAHAHVYFVGAHTGCSCGFDVDEGDDDEAAGRESLRQLRAFLEAAVRTAGTLELFACWNGDEGVTPELRETITADYFDDRSERFALPERWFALLAMTAD